MQMLTLPPWAFAVWLATFLVGVVAGRYYERHTLYKESTMRKVVTVYNAWYYRRAPALVTGVAVIALIGIWLAAAATITNGQQDRRADARDTAVQRCFDRWADAQSASSTAVREASVAKDEATKRFNQALNDEGAAFKKLVKKILAQDVQPTDVKKLYDTLAARDRAGRAVERAQAGLDKARKDNPVPDAPSEFCSVKP
jgi:hypothetical protein